MSVKGIIKQAATYQGVDKAVTNTNNAVSVVQASANISAYSTQKVVTVDLKNGSSDAKQQKDQNAEQARMQNVINEVNIKLKPTKTKFEYSYHEEVNRVSIKVLDKDTDEVIKEIPPEESIKVIEKIYEIAGLLVDEKR